MFLKLQLVHVNKSVAEECCSTDVQLWANLLHLAPLSMRLSQTLSNSGRFLLLQMSLASILELLCVNEPTPAFSAQQYACCHLTEHSKA